ncbi:hypothetical protein ACTXT7_010298 [Hymenolepis weldensis]
MPHVGFDKSAMIALTPPANPVALFGDSNLTQEAFSKPSLIGLGGSTDWSLPEKPVTNNQFVPMSYQQPVSYEQSWQLPNDQSQYGTLYTSTPATNGLLSKSTNPFL